MKTKIKWDRPARNQLKEAYKYIRKDSLANAEKVRRDIVENARSLRDHSARYPADKYKIGNDGSYRVFVLHNYRISYRISANEITILRLRHTKMEPLEY